MRRIARSLIAVVAASAIAGGRASAQEARQVVVPTGSAAPAATAAAAPKPADESLDLVGPTEAQKARAKAAAEAKAKAEAEARRKAEEAEKARLAEEARKKAEEDRRRAEAERKAREEAERIAKIEAERKAREEAARKAEQERLARLEAERKAREAEEARRKAEEAEKARLAEIARQRAEEEQRRRAEIEAQIRAETERRLKVEAEERARKERELAEAKARLEREAAEARARAEAEARAKVEREAKLREEIERRVRAQVEAEVRAQLEKEEKARLRAEAKKSKGKKKKNGAHAEAPLPELPQVAAAGAQPASVPPLPALPALPAATTAAPAASPATAVTAADVKKADPALAEVKGYSEPAKAGGARVVVPAVASSRSGGTQVAMLTPASPGVVAMPMAQNESRALAIPRDEDTRRARHVDLRNALQLGPQGLVLNKLDAAADLAPGMLAGAFGYRFAIDDASGMHHHFTLGAASPLHAEGEPEREYRWFANAGLSPKGSGSYGIRRNVGGQDRTMADRLDWSSFTVAAGILRNIPRQGGGFELGADAQLQGVSVTFVKNSNSSTAQELRDADATQLRIRGTASYLAGRFTGTAQLAGYLYVGGKPEGFIGMPLRGVFIEDDMGGLASAPQQLQARVGGQYELNDRFSIAGRYSFLGYSQSDWSSAHLVHGELNGRFGRVRAALGFTWQYDAPQIAAPGSGIGDYSSLYLTGSIGYAF